MRLGSARHRYVIDEPEIPFALEVLYEDSGIIVVDKPHFLATTPRGMWYRQSALIRLREMFGEPDIIPAHRLDRMTAGIVVFVRDPALRGAYQMLFQERRATKTYECLAPLAPVGANLVPGADGRVHPTRTGTVTRLEPPRPFPLLRRSHIVKDRGRLQAYEVPGEINAETLIEREILRSAQNDNVGVAQDDNKNAFCHPGRRDSAICNVSCHPERRGGGPEPKDLATPRRPLTRYVLHPRTGKTHQLRVHMASLGLPIVDDDLYPAIATRPYDDFSTPLQLVARRLSFIDPVTNEPREFTSRIPLAA